MIQLLRELIDLLEEYQQINPNQGDNMSDFAQWLSKRMNLQQSEHNKEPDWEGKAGGRSPDSVINTSLIRLYRYARHHAKAAIDETIFSTPDEFIYLITLRHTGSMTKTELIRKNIHEKSAGIQIINRLLKQGLVSQSNTPIDKRNKIVEITPKGILHLENSMKEIRRASAIVTGDLTHTEKITLIRLLLKLEKYHFENTDII